MIDFQCLGCCHGAGKFISTGIILECISDGFGHTVKQIAYTYCKLFVCRGRKVWVTTVNHHDNQQMWATHDPAAPAYDLAAPRRSVPLYSEHEELTFFYFCFKMLLNYIY